MKTYLRMCTGTLVSTLVSTFLLTACSSSPDNEAPNNPNLPDQGRVEPVTTNYITFESGAVRPVAISSNGKTVLITNTPNHSLDVFQYGENDQLTFRQSIPVGMEPVAVGFANDQEAWVVNHVSDSISIVNLDDSVPHVTRTLLVGDEPRDIVFANGKAFITTAHRGQQREQSYLSGVEGAGDSQLVTASVKRADVWVFDINDLGTTLGGRPQKIIELFGDTPRALAVSHDQQTVYAAVFHSGNQTTAVHEAVMCHGFTDDDIGNKPCDTLDGIQSPNGLANGQLPGGRTAPGINKDGKYQPWTSMIVQYDRESGQWLSSDDRNFSNGVRFNLPDYDVFAIDANTLQQTQQYSHVGTTLFNMAVHPTSNTLFVSNTEANNATRFEGPGNFSPSTVQGNIAKSRLTTINLTNGEVNPRPLNTHINYADLKGNDSQHSVALPNQLAFSEDGNQLYLASMGSNKVAIYHSQQLMDDSLWDGQGAEFDSEAVATNHIEVNGGPAGLALHQEKNQLLVYTRFDNALVQVDLNTKQELSRHTLNNPEPESLQQGRPFLYDAAFSSSNGEAACASCHIYGDGDQLAWNLGNPDASNTKNPQPFPTKKFSRLGCDFGEPGDASCELLQILNGDGDIETIASMKGPMFTQTLRGMSTHGHMHWRGDRAVGYFGNDTEQTLDERVSFKNFIVAFEGLLGMDIDLPESVGSQNKSQAVVTLENNMEHFANFMLAVQMPPNPIRDLDNGLSASAQLGRDFYLGNRRSDGLAFDSNQNGPEQDGVNCEGCHGLDPLKGFYGTRGEVAHGGEIQILKVPQLRNLYTRVGMFGLPDRTGFLPSDTQQHQGDQIRGFGFLHDGATDKLLNFLRGGVFDNGDDPCPVGLTNAHGCEFNAGPVGIPNEETRQGLVDYLMEFDSDLAPIVGQQITLNSNSPEAVSDRLSLLEDRAQSPFPSKILGGASRECEVIAQGKVNDEMRGYWFDGVSYVSDRQADADISSEQIRALATSNGNSLTFTCAVPNWGRMWSIDHDQDGVLNGDDV